MIWGGVGVGWGGWGAYQDQFEAKKKNGKNKIDKNYVLYLLIISNKNAQF